MSDSDPKKPELEIHSDEDWKSRVKAEDARLDAERNATTSDAKPPTEEKSPAESSPPVGIPLRSMLLNSPAEFTTLAGYVRLAKAALGVIPVRSTERPASTSRLPNTTISWESSMKKPGEICPNWKVRCLTPLHELRMAYVELSRQGGR
ncbi:MAG: hypothetical protein R3B91_21850 [Planctomycetaceae bacterium]